MHAIAEDTLFSECEHVLYLFAVAVANTITQIASSTMAVKCWFVLSIVMSVGIFITYGKFILSANNVVR